MKMQRVLLPLTAVVVCSIAAANEPFDGTWKLNVDQSHAMPVTMSWQNIGNGEVRFTNANESYTYKIDGRAFTTPTGELQAVEKITDNLYKMTTNRPGVAVIVESLRISSDGNTLSLDRKATRPNAQSNESHDFFTRKSGTTGLTGVWELADAAKPSPQTLFIRPTGEHSFSLSFQPDSSTVDAKWDGKDYAYKGPTVQASSTMAFSTVGQNRFKVVHKVKGRIIEILNFKLSADDRSMSMDATNGQGQKLVVDYWEK